MFSLPDKSISDPMATSASLLPSTSGSISDPMTTSASLLPSTSGSVSPTNVSNVSGFLVPVLAGVMAPLACIVVAVVGTMAAAVCYKHRLTNTSKAKITASSAVSISSEENIPSEHTIESYPVTPVPDSYRELENVFDYEEPLSNSRGGGMAGSYEDVYNSMVHGNAGVSTEQLLQGNAEYSHLEASLQPQPYEVRNYLE